MNTTTHSALEYLKTAYSDVLWCDALVQTTQCGGSSPPDYERFRCHHRVNVSTPLGRRIGIPFRRRRSDDLFYRVLPGGKPVTLLIWFDGEHRQVSSQVITPDGFTVAKGLLHSLVGDQGEIVCFFLPHALSMPFQPTFLAIERCFRKLEKVVVQSSTHTCRFFYTKHYTFDDPRVTLEEMGDGCSFCIFRYDDHEILLLSTQIHSIMHQALEYLYQRHLTDRIFFEPTSVKGFLTPVKQGELPVVTPGHRCFRKIFASNNLGKPISTAFFMYGAEVTYYRSLLQRGYLQVWLWTEDQKCPVAKIDLNPNEPISVPAGTVHLVYSQLGEVICFVSTPADDFPGRCLLVGDDVFMAQTTRV